MFARASVLAFLFAVLLWPNPGLTHTIAEVLHNPTAFDQQPIVVSGEVANVVTRYGETALTTFDLLDSQGAVLSILVSGVPQCKQGEACRVQGLFVAQKQMVLPEKVERLSEAQYKGAGMLFRHKKGGGGAPLGGSKALRGVYIPQ
jgi:hypothetical protein